MDAGELVRLYGQGRRDFIQTDFREADLRGADLSGAVFTGADLRGADLRGADLRGADFTGADLRGADFTGADFRRTDFTGADLRGANLREVQINQTTKLDDKWYLVWEILNHPTRERNLRGADLSEANLRAANLRAANLSEADLSEANFCLASFREANLRAANLSEANLNLASFSLANLRAANLSEASLRAANLRAANLSEANLSEASLRAANFKAANFRAANLSEANFSEANLSEANLSEANLSLANLSLVNFCEADLSGADFSGADLSGVQLLAAKLEGATLTGACIEDWNINSGTNLDDVICDYIYLKENQQERRPHTGNFAPGEFTKLFQKSLETVDLIFREGVDWKAFLISFQKLRVECDSDELSILSFENKGDGAFVVRVNVPSSANKTEIEKYLKRQYQLEAKLEAKSEQLANLLEITKLLASKPINIEAKSESSSMSENQKTENKFFAPVTGIVGDQGSIGNNAGEVKGYQINYPAEKSQTLAEAAEEIHKLLKQLEETYPTTTPEEKQSAIAIILQQEIKQNPTFKAKLVNALKEGGIETLKVLFAPIGIPIEMARGWIEAEAE